MTAEGGAGVPDPPPLDRDLDEALARCREREAEVDRSEMRDLVAAFPDDLAAAVDRALPFARGLDAAPPTAIVVAGMGGSAIAGDLAGAFSEDARSVPLVTVRGYTLPAWIDERAWLLASSYSGETEETLAVWREARRRGVPGAAVTTGGRLGEEARDAGLPVLELPGGLPPRAALGWSFPAVALAAAAVDPALDAGGIAERVVEAAGLLAGRGDEWLAWERGNPVLDVAASAAAGLPIVYGGHAVAVAAARRWKAQLNENGKVPAWWGEFPEHNHNEIVGFESDGPALADVVLVDLETPWDHPRVTRRFELVRALCAGRVAAQHRVVAPAGDPLAGMLWLCMFGDCASFLVSVITGKDPSPVSSIDRLKAELSAETPSPRETT